MFEHVFDLCVIGSGPAGIIVALEYANLNPAKTVLLVEYARPNQPVKNALDDAIEIDNMVNHHSSYECTNKGLGGTSATWGGRCVMYDDVDFISRPGLDGSCTWDLKLFADVKQYLPRTADYFECGDPNFNLEAVPQYRDTRIAEGFEAGIVTDKALERWSMPTRFGKRYRESLIANPNITVAEGYEGRDFSAPNDQGIVDRLVVREVRTKEYHQVQAKSFVLAAGTQETTRMLLRNRHLFQNLDQTPEALGKYYQSHLSGKIASVKFKGDARKTNHGFLRDEKGIYLRRRFQFSTNFLVENNLLNTAIWLDNPLYYDPKHRSGAMSFMYLAMIAPVLRKKLAPPAIALSITRGRREGISKHLWNILREFPGSVLIPTSIFYRRYCLRRKLPGVFLHSRNNTYALHFHSEQVPDANNRMELAPDGETLQIRYALTDHDINSVIRLHDELDKWLRKCNCGELEYWFSKTELPQTIRAISRDGIHQSGTTRIADSPEKGVVDRNLKLFGTSNIFVCSSSVFPTSSQANPTFFTGAFAVRLAKYLTLN